MAASHAAPSADAAQAPALGSARAVVSAGALVAVATVAVNGLAYVVPVLAARLLPPDQLGALAALLAVGTVVGVVGLGLQTALAVRWARHDRVEGADRLSVLATAAATAALIVAVPVLSVMLHVPLLQPLVLAVQTAPVILAGRWLGELQGRQRYGRLSVAMVVLALGRYGGVLAALAAGLGVTAALAIGALAAWAAVAVLAWLAARAPDSTDPATRAPAQRVRGREVLRAGSATIVMLAISYADLILARALLPADDAGAYAVGALLTKGALWAPGVLTVLALPMFAQARLYAVRLTLAATAGCGAVLVLAAAVAGDLAVRLAGGRQYAHLGPDAVWFAAIGALYALVFVIVNAEIAKIGRRPALTLWVALVGIAVVAALSRPSTVGGVLLLSVGTAATTLAATTVVYLLRLRRHRAAAALTAPQPRQPLEPPIARS